MDVSASANNLKFSENWDSDHFDILVTNNGVKLGRSKKQHKTKNYFWTKINSAKFEMDKQLQLKKLFLFKLKFNLKQTSVKLY